MGPFVICHYLSCSGVQYMSAFGTLLSFGKGHTKQNKQDWKVLLLLQTWERNSLASWKSTSLPSSAFFSLLLIILSCMICCRIVMSGLVMSSSTSGLLIWLAKPSPITSGRYLIGWDEKTREEIAATSLGHFCLKKNNFIMGVGERIWLMRGFFFKARLYLNLFT